MERTRGRIDQYDCGIFYCRLYISNYAAACTANFGSPRNTIVSYGGYSFKLLQPGIAAANRVCTNIVAGLCVDKPRDCSAVFKTSQGLALAHKVPDGCIAIFGDCLYHWASY